MSVLFRRLFTTAIFRRFSNLAIVTPNFMKKFYNSGFEPEFSVSMLNEFLTLLRDYVYEMRKYYAKLAEKYISKRNMKSFSNETLSLFFREFCFSYILDLPKTIWALRIPSQKFTRNFVMQEFWAPEIHVHVNMLHCSSHFKEAH